MTGSRMRSAASMRYSSTLSRTSASSRRPSAEGAALTTWGGAGGFSRSARSSSGTTSTTVPWPSAARVCEAKTTSVAAFSQATAYVPCQRSAVPRVLRSSGGAVPADWSSRSTYARPPTCSADHPNSSDAASFHPVTSPVPEISTTPTSARSDERGTCVVAAVSGVPLRSHSTHTRLLVLVYSTPQAEDRDVVITSPRPCSAVSSGGPGATGSLRPGCWSSTSMRRWAPRSASVRRAGVPAWTTAFVTSSLTISDAVSTSSPAPHESRVLPREPPCLGDGPRVGGEGLLSAHGE